MAFCGLVSENEEETIKKNLFKLQVTRHVWRLMHQLGAKDMFLRHSYLLNYAIIIASDWAEILNHLMHQLTLWFQECGSRPHPASGRPA